MTTATTDALIERAEQLDYQRLFIYDLHWNKPDHPPITYTDPDSDLTLTAVNVSSYKGIRVFVCDQLPGSRVEAAVDHLIGKTTTDRLVIFHNDTEQVWRWPVRSGTTSRRLARHRHRHGVANQNFAARLAAIRLPIDDPPDPSAVLSILRSAFDVEVRNETRVASKLMARLYTAMERAYPDTMAKRSRDHEISVTMARLLFLMFGDDTEMWKPNLFRDFVLDNTSNDGSDIGQQLTDLFAYLDTPESERESEDRFIGFRYVNGGIFHERLTLPAINAEFRTAILDACNRDWATISPAIFGSMFQSVRDAATRRQLGEHYTSEENILKTLNPLFLDELRADFARASSMKNEPLALRRLRERLGQIRFMDPACGCGNFIIVAYRELRDIELAIIERLQDLAIAADGSEQPFLLANEGLQVTLDHFYGIEIDEWPARIAETAMFLIDRQCDLKLTERLGHSLDRLPIKLQATVHVGNALRTDWARICPPTKTVMVAGNPPFLGHATRTAEQTEDLRTTWGRDDISRLDYVTGWHAKALAYFGDISGRWAFVTTNSITQGDPVPHLFEPIFDAGWRIRFAHRTFPWSSEAVGKAAVHCVIVGFDRETSPARLYDYDRDGTMLRESQTSNINAYLVSGPNVFITKRPSPLADALPAATFGAMARDGGHLIIERDQIEEMRRDPVAAKFIRPYVGSAELLHGTARWCLWLTEMTPADLGASRLLQARVDAVRKFRLDSRADSTRQMARTAHLFGQRPPEHTAPYLCIPRHVSETRPYFLAARFGPDVICSDANFSASDPDGFMFAVISSAMFLAWQKTVGGRIKSDLRFSNTIVWNNFPLPSIGVALRAEISTAGRGVVTARDESGGTLADQYTEPMAPGLLAAHAALDECVDRAFGASGCRTEEERQEILFRKYAQFSGDLD